MAGNQKHYPIRDFMFLDDYFIYRPFMLCVGVHAPLNHGAHGHGFLNYCYGYAGGRVYGYDCECEPDFHDYVRAYGCVRVHAYAAD